MTSVVRPAASSASDCWIARSVSVSSARGRLVQDQDRRVLQEHPRDGEPLLLPAGELHAALADDRVQPVRQRVDHRLQPRAPRRLPDLGLGRVEPPVGDVLADRAGEEEDVLLHDADLPPQRGERHLADVDAVDGDAARRRPRRSAAAASRSSSCPRRTARRTRPSRPARIVRSMSRSTCRSGA